MCTSTISGGLHLEDRTTQGTVQHLEHQAEYHIRGISEIEKASLGDEYVVLVQWEGLDEAEKYVGTGVSDLRGCACDAEKTDPPVKAACCG